MAYFKNSAYFKEQKCRFVFDTIFRNVIEVIKCATN